MIKLCKRRISFYSHIARMNNGMLTEQVFDFLKSKRTTLKWFKLQNIR